MTIFNYIFMFSGYNIVQSQKISSYFLSKINNLSNYSAIMSKGIKKSSCWLKRIQQQQEMGRQFNYGLFVDTCLSSQSLHNKDIIKSRIRDFFAVEFSHDEKFLAGGYDRILLWPINTLHDNPNTDTPIMMKGNNGYFDDIISSLAFSQDNKLILCGVLGPMIFIHDLER